MFKDFLNLIYPTVCIACEKPISGSSDPICFSCQLQLPITNNHLEYDYEIAKRLMGRMNCKYTLAYLKYRKKGIVQELIAQFKYEGFDQVGQYLGKKYGEELKRAKLDSQFDVVVPVPLHPKKLRKRGFNQSTVFGKALADTMGLEFSETLQRKTNTKTQTKKNRINRWLNVEEIFTVEDPSILENKNVLLVDDILTTGATFEACGQEILKSNVRTISVLAMAVAI